MTNNELNRSCSTCIHSNTDLPEDSDRWIECVKGQIPDDDNVNNACAEYALNPCFLKGM